MPFREQAFANLFNSLLGSVLMEERSNDTMMRLAWERLTDEQKDEIAQRIHAAALARIEKVTEAAVWNGGRGLFREFITKEARELFQDPKLKGRVLDTLREVVEAELATVRQKAGGEIERFRQEYEGRLRRLFSPF